VATLAAPPDAGSTVQSIESQRPEIPQQIKPNVEIQQPRPVAAPDSGIKIPVSSFNISGNSIYSADALQTLIQDGLGKELTLAEIEALAGRITQHYRSNGYLLAQAYLPAQDIRDGKVEIAVLEGKYGNINVSNAGALSSVPITVTSGEVVALDSLERNLLLLSDTPGVEVKSTLRPGASVGTSDLVIDVTPGKLITGSVDLDNYGNRFTGQERLGTTINLNNPLGLGDLLNLRAQTGGSGLNYGRLSYQLPVNAYGTKVGAAYSDTGYRLGKNFAVLDSHGDAQIGTLFVAHPIIRSRITNLNVQVGLDDKRMEDRVDSTDIITRKAVQVWNLGLSGDHRDGLWGGGISTFSATLSFGNLDIKSPLAKAIDDLTAKTDGGYNKFSLNLLRLQSLTDDTSLYLAYTGQVAGQNLDSSEKFSLGGAYGVRAYPQGEASADEAHLITAELRHTLPAGFQLVGFLDTGRAKLNEDRWPAATGQNTRTLSDWGLGLNWSHPEGYVVKAFYAHKIGNADATSDNDKTERFWIQAVKSF
jgi:hemolysin activation/secretion protein